MARGEPLVLLRLALRRPNGELLAEDVLRSSCGGLPPGRAPQLHLDVDAVGGLGLQVRAFPSAQPSSARAFLCLCAALDPRPFYSARRPTHPPTRMMGSHGGGLGCRCVAAASRGGRAARWRAALDGWAAGHTSTGAHSARAAAYYLQLCSHACACVLRLMGSCHLSHNHIFLAVRCLLLCCLTAWVCINGLYWPRPQLAHRNPQSTIRQRPVVAEGHMRHWAGLRQRP